VTTSILPSSFNEATEAALNALYKFILSAFSTPEFSYAHKASDDNSNCRVTVKTIGQKDRGIVSLLPYFFDNLAALIIIKLNRRRSKWRSTTYTSCRLEKCRRGGLGGEYQRRRRAH
jgi:hypothetical protein